MSSIDLSFYRPLLQKARQGNVGGVEALKACCPFHEDSTPSFVLFENGGYSCAGCGKHGYVSDVNDVLGLPRDVNAERQQGSSSWLEHTDEYKDANGVVVGKVERYRKANGDKTPIPSTKNALGDWDRKVHYAFPIFQWDKVSAASPLTPLFWVEGEKCANAVAGIGLLATTTQGGSKAFSRVDKESLVCLKGRTVYLLPDADDPGEAYMSEVCKELRRRRCLVTIVRLPGLEKSEDVVEWLERGGTKEALEALASAQTQLGADAARLARAARAVADALDEGADVNEARKTLLREAASVDNAHKASRTGHELLLELAEYIDSGEANQGFWWRLKPLDAVMDCPFHRGDLVCLGGSSGAGKTALAVQLCDTVCNEGGAGYVISQEMSGRDIMGRVAARIFRKRVKELVGSEVRQLAAVYSSLSIEVYDEAVDMEFLDSELRMWKAQHDNAAIVVLDFIQLMIPPSAPGSKDANEWSMIASYAPRMKALARELGVVFVVLCQFSSDYDKSQLFKRRAPSRADLRSAGPLVQASDKTWLIWQPEEDSWDVECILDKNRGGPTGKCKVRFDKPHFSFLELSGESIDKDNASRYSDGHSNVVYFEDVDF